MIIQNALVYQDGRFVPGGLEFGRTIRSFCPPAPVKDGMDAEGGYLIPGLIDVHTHGAMGADASDADPDGLQTMARYYAAGGVTSWLPTTMTLKEPELTGALRCIRDYKRPADGAKVAGIHMEGPFVNREKCGAQNPDNISAPDLSLFHRLNEASGHLVRLITLAPETEGAMDFIREAKAECTVSVGHTAADYDTALSAFEAGASHATHLFNAMPALGHRAPGVVAAASDAGVRVELICDGYHIHPSVVRLTHRLFGDRLILISDSLRCAGMPDGDYELGGQMITMKNGRATLKGSETIAGSSIHLMEGLRRAVSFGIPLEDAVRAATETPAAAIGLQHEIGSLLPGRCADLVLLDRDLKVKAVFIDGERIAG